MTEKLLSLAIIVVAASAAGLLLGWWLDPAPAQNLAVRLPIPENQAPAMPDAPVDLEGGFRKGSEAPAGLPGSWPGFRGPGFQNVVQDGLPLADRWPPQGPPVRWRVELGEGHAGPAVWEGRVYILDYDAQRKADTLRCLSLGTGGEIWRRWYEVRIKRNHGMSRTVPAVGGGSVVTLGPKCHVLCADARSGAFRWGVDLVSELGTQVPMWYTGQCPLIDGGTVVLAPAGRVLLQGRDLATGQVVWETPNLSSWSMSHSCVMPMTLLGQRTYVYCALGGMVGVSAEEETRGKILWQTDEWNHPVVAPSPVPLGPDRIFVTAGYGVGSAIFSLTREGDSIRVSLEKRLDRRTLACEQHTPIFFGGHLYTILPNDAGPVRRQLVCADHTGRVVWRSGKAHRFGLGPFLVADEKIFILDDRGELTLARASSGSYLPLAKARVLQGRDAWGPMALAGGLLLLRDSKQLICLDVRNQGEKR